MSVHVLKKNNLVFLLFFPRDIGLSSIMVRGEVEYSNFYLGWSQLYLYWMYLCFSLTLSDVEVCGAWLKCQIFPIYFWIKLCQGPRTCSYAVSLCLSIHPAPTDVFLSQPKSKSEKQGRNCRPVISPCTWGTFGLQAFQSDHVVLQNRPVALCLQKALQLQPVSPRTQTRCM